MDAQTIPISIAHAGEHSFLSGYTSPGESPLKVRLRGLVTRLTDASTSLSEKSVAKALCWIADEGHRADAEETLKGAFAEYATVTVLRGALPFGAEAGLELTFFRAQPGTGREGRFAATAALAIDRATTTRLVSATNISSETQIVWDTILQRIGSLGATTADIVTVTAYLNNIADYAPFTTAYSKITGRTAIPFASAIGVTGECRLQLKVLAWLPSSPTIRPCSDL